MIRHLIAIGWAGFVLALVLVPAIGAETEANVAPAAGSSDGQFKLLLPAFEARIEK